MYKIVMKCHSCVMSNECTSDTMTVRCFANEATLHRDVSKMALMECHFM